MGLLERGHPQASLSRQCRLLGISRSAAYYEPRAVSAETLALMRRIDETYLEQPLYGSRQICVEALAAAGEAGGAPEIFDTDQGSQFTSEAFTGQVQALGARMSMDGQERCLDNVFIERLWRSLKYKAVYLAEWEDGFAAERGIGAWMEFYNRRRPHSALGGLTPWEAVQGQGEVPRLKGR